MNRKTPARAGVFSCPDKHIHAEVTPERVDPADAKGAKWHLNVATRESSTMLTRRHFVISAAALFSAPIAGPSLAAPSSNRANWDAWDALITPIGYDPATSNPWGVHRRFLPHVVEANPGLKVGDIHVDAVARYLYHIREGGIAMRYGVAIAKGNPVRARHLPDRAQGQVAHVDPDREHDQA